MYYHVPLHFLSLIKIKLTNFTLYFLSVQRFLMQEKLLGVTKFLATKLAYNFSLLDMSSQIWFLWKLLLAISAFKVAFVHMLFQLSHIAKVYLALSATIKRLPLIIKVCLYMLQPTFILCECCLAVITWERNWHCVMHLNSMLHQNIASIKALVALLTLKSLISLMCSLNVPPLITFGLECLITLFTTVLLTTSQPCEESVVFCYRNSNCMWNTLL